MASSPGAGRDGGGTRGQQCQRAPDSGDSNQSGPRRPWRTAKFTALLQAIAPVLFLLFCIVSPQSALGWPAGLPPRVAVSPAGSSFATIVTDIAFLSPRYSFVATKNGLVYLYDGTDFGYKPGQKPVIMVNTRVKPAIGDIGLTSIAIHPDFIRDGKEGYIYLSYTEDVSKTCQTPGQMCSIKRNKISRFRLRWVEWKRSFDVIEEVVVFGKCTRMRESWWGDDCSPVVGTTHELNHIWFGPDGMLWAAVGDGELLEGTLWTESWLSIAGANRALSMDVNFLGGKILRMNTNTTDGVLVGLSDNPFYAGSVVQARSMVWAVGFRNPWRCSHYPVNNPNSVICSSVGYFTFESGRS